MPVVRRKPNHRGRPSSGSSSTMEKTFFKIFNRHWNKWFGSDKMKRPVHLKKFKKDEDDSDHLDHPSDDLMDGDANGGDKADDISWTTAFKVLLSARLCSALFSNIMDCDETFNYWEPAHYLVHGHGLQTWEYSPVYAIRSYAYLWLYAGPAQLYGHLSPNKTLVFYVTRCFLAAVCAVCETYFFRGITRHFGAISRLVIPILVFSCGLFISSTSFLPSTMSMYMTYLIFGSWMQHHLRRCILFLALNALMGWPFASLLCIPVAVHVLWVHKPEGDPLDRNYHSEPKMPPKTLGDKINFFIKWALLAAAIVGIPLVMIDSFYYGKLVIAPLNIVMYNVFSTKGPELYGTEPWTFYLANLFLNFNLIFVVSIAYPFMLVIARYTLHNKMEQNRHQNRLVRVFSVDSYHVTIMASVILWYGVFMFQAHKEERFMYPIYPIICLTGAIVFEIGYKLVYTWAPSWANGAFNLSGIIFVLFVVLSLSRGAALFKGYHAPMDVYMKLEQVNDNLMDMNFTPNEVNVCVGKEWHRFPNSFFLPDDRWHLRFLKSEFKGQLPQEYTMGEDGTRIIPTHMNDNNREETSRYVHLSRCHFIVDTDYPTYSDLDIPYSKKGDQFEVIFSAPFMDSTRTPFPFRSFYIPFTHHKSFYVSYNLMRNVHTTPSMLLST